MYPVRQILLVHEIETPKGDGGELPIQEATTRKNAGIRKGKDQPVRGFIKTKTVGGSHSTMDQVQGGPVKKVKKKIGALVSGQKKKAPGKGGR